MSDLGVKTLRAIDDSDNLEDALIDALRELTDTRAQLAEAKALLKEAEPYTVTDGWALYDLSATWEDRRCALLGEE